MIKGYFAVNDFYVFNADLWEYFLKKDILAFAQFVKDYEVQPIAIGIPLVSFRHKIGGCLDLVCKMNDRLPTKTIKPKRVTAVVDYKSKIGSFKENGERNSFYEEHEIQLHVYRRLLRENFPKIRVQKLFNWSPKNWRGTPNYNVKDQTWVQSRLKIPHLLGLHKILMADKNPSVTIIDGRIEVGKSLEDNYKTYELNQFIINKHQAMKGERA